MGNKKNRFRIGLLCTLCIAFGISAIYLKKEEGTQVHASYEQGEEKHHFFKQNEQAQKIPVITYHQLFKQSDFYNHKNDMNVSEEEFEKQMEFLAKNNYKTITLTEFYNFIYYKQSLPKKSVLLTFDDGPKTNYIYAYPILKKNNLHAVSFLITNRIKNEVKPFTRNATQALSLPEINQMRDVFEFGSHSHAMHGRENGIPLLVKSNKKDIQKDALISKPYTTFLAYCYPFGQHKEKTIEGIQDAGFKLAFSTEEGYATSNSPLYNIPRIAVFPKTTLEEFEKIVDGTWIKNIKK